MFQKFFIPVLLETDAILLSVSLLSILFFFFFVKVKFQKTASLKAYGILFYAFVFYSISALSYVLLNAEDSFLRYGADLYSGYVWFFPIVILSALFGAASGWLIYFAASKIAEPYAYKMLNLSLIIIAPALVYSVLVKPFKQTFQMVIPAEAIENLKAKEINTQKFSELNQKPNEVFFPSAPASFSDSLDISVVSGQVIQVRSKQNGFTYTQRIPFGNVQTLYASHLTSPRLLALLALASPIEKKSALLIFDSLGICVYQKVFDNYPNRMSSSENQKYLLLQAEVSPDSLEFKTCLQLN